MTTHQQDSIAWWRAKKDDRHDTLWRWVNYCQKQQSVQRMDTRIFVSAVNNFNPTGNDEMDYAIRSAFPYKIRDNILQAGRDTAVSMIALARTAPQYLTTAAEWQTSRKAEQRSRVLQSQFYDLKIFDHVPKAFAGGCEGGTGWVYGEVGPDGLPRVGRCLHNEVVWDPEDGRYGLPLRLARIYFVDRDELIASHKKFEDKILGASGPTNQDYADFFLQRPNQANRVRVVEAWTLPTVDGGSDGAYVKTISNATILDQAYTKRRHRIVRVLFAERDQGFGGQSLTERMLQAQLRLTEIDDYIAASQRLGSMSKWFTFSNSGVDGDMLTNVACQVLEVREGSTPPTLVTSSATPPDLAEQRREIKQDAYDAQGFGDNTVTGDVNKGLASGEAVQRADDVKVRRFLNPARLLERTYLDITRLLEDLNDACCELDPEYEVKARARSGRRTWIKTSKWKDLQLSESDASVQMFPISAQATTAASKWERVDNWIARGFVSKPQAMDLMEFPDTEAFEALENANYDLIHEQIDNIIDEAGREEMLLPIPEQDLELAAYTVTNARLVSWRLGAPDDVIGRFDAYLGYVQDLQAKALEAQQPPAAAEPAPAALGEEALAAAQLAQQGAPPPQMMPGAMAQA